MVELKDIDRLLEMMIQLGASDMHLAHNAKLTYRVDGKIRQTNKFVSGDDIFALALQMLEQTQVRTYNKELRVDFSYQYEQTRFRGILGKQRNQSHLVMRRINATITPFDETSLPPIIKDIVQSSWGMFLVTGPTGSGKSTSLASVIDYINETKPLHIVTIEEPLEYLHENKQCFVTQREVGRDTLSFPDSMVDVLRQDPDIILVGEMRDLETVSAAVTNAGTGHLVFGTLHTNTAPQAIERIIDLYPEQLRPSVLGQLATNLRGILNQRLVPKPGGGRTAIYELMVINEEMRVAIRENRFYDLYEIMERYRHEGNILMTDSIKEAKAKGLMEGDIVW